MLLDRSHTPIILERTTFEMVGRKHYKRPNVITRAWNDCACAAEVLVEMSRGERRRRWDDRPEGSNLNFTELMKAVRKLERGEHHIMLLGQTAWDIVAEIYNHDLPSDSTDYMISWSPPIHTDLRNGEFRRHKAVETLQAAYAELGTLVVASSIEPVA